MTPKVALRSSLKTRITLATLAIFLASIWVLAFYTSRMVREDMESAMGSQQLSTASFVAAAVTQELGERLAALQAVASIISPAVLDNSTAAQAFLGQRPDLLGQFNGGIFVVSRGGTATASLPLALKRTDLNFMGQALIAAALNEGKAGIGSPRIGVALQVPVLSMAVPIRDSRSKVIGALVGVTDLSKPNILEKIAGNRYGETGGYVLVEKLHRTVVTASDRKRIMEVLPAAGINPLIDRFMQGFEGTGVTVNPGGIEVLASAKGIPVAGWYVVVALPTAEAFATIRDMQLRMLIAALTLTLGVGIATWWILKHQLGPLDAAAQAVASMVSIPEQTKPIPVRSNDEIGVLVGGFNQLLRSLGEGEEALKESEFRWKFAVEGSGDGLWDWNIVGSTVFFSRRWKEMLGFDEAEIGNGLDEWEKRVHPEDLSTVLPALQACLDGTTPIYTSEHRVRCKDGSYKWLLDRGMVVARDKDGKPLRMIGTHGDITQRMQLMQELADYREQLEALVAKKTLALSEEKGLLQALIDTIPFGAYRVRNKLGSTDDHQASGFPAFQLEMASTRCCELLGITPVEAPKVLGMSIEHIHPDDRREFVRLNLEAHAQLKPFAWEGRMKVHEDYRWMRIDSTPRITVDDVVWSGIVQDVTERRQHGSLLYRSVIEASPDAFIAIDEDERIVEWSPQAERLFGWSLDEAVGKTLTQTIIPASAPINHIHHLRDFVATGRDGVIGSLRRLTAVNRDGREFPVELRVMALQIDAHWRFTSFIRDITDDLHLERQLVQAQKLEAISHLSSGLAHDFNNILGIVIGNLDLLSLDVPAGEPREILAAAMAAAQRGAEVTKSLMAVARRGTLVRADSDINRLLLDLAPLLLQTAGKKIQLTVTPSAEAACASLDPGGFSNALLNIVINARDAMPEGGEVLVYCYSTQVEKDNKEFANLGPGMYWLVGVDDTGTGMTPEVAKNAFDPFFTTKGRDKGTGLGLAMVFAFAHQSSGTARILSAPGKGTSVQMLFPAVARTTTADQRKDCPVPARQEGAATPSKGRILVVDDEASLLKIASRWLTDLGYAVVTADAAEAAIDALGRARFDVLMTDIVMPGDMGGAALAHHAANLYPQMHILLASGNAEGLTDEDRARWTLLEKPLSRRVLSDAMAIALHPQIHREV